MVFSRLQAEVISSTPRLLGEGSLVNPIQHGATANEIATYKVEPYVMAADVYGVAPHVGRGGWTWYSGSAGWMYQLILESFIGLKREGNTIQFNPCIPAEWKSFKVRYQFEETVYLITIIQEAEKEVTEKVVDGEIKTTQIIQLINDVKEHSVTITVRGNFT